MSPVDKAEIRTREAIADFEKETGVPVAGSAVLEEQFEYIRKLFLIHAILGEMRFRRRYPEA